MCVHINVDVVVERERLTSRVCSLWILFVDVLRHSKVTLLASSPQ